MPTEGHTTGGYQWAGLTGSPGAYGHKAGQRLTVPGCLITKLSFFLLRAGSPGGTITYTIRKTDGYPGTLLASKLQGNANDISDTDGTWYEVTLDTPVFVNEQVRLLVEVSEGTTSNHILFYYNGDAKPNEGIAYANNLDTAWGDSGTGTAEIYYIYTYDTYLPTVTTQAVTDIVETTATGNGNITSLGSPNPTQHGHCWNTTGTPTTADSKTENGAASQTGAFTSAIAGLTAEVKYYVRAYTTNSAGTSYGNEVIFWADKGTVYPDPVMYSLMRVSSIRHIARPGTFRMEAVIGDLGFNVDVAEATVRREAGLEPEYIMPSEAKPSELITKMSLIPGIRPAPPGGAAVTIGPVIRPEMGSSEFMRLLAEVRALSAEAWLPSTSEEVRQALNAAIKVKTDRLYQMGGTGR